MRFFECSPKLVEDSFREYFCTPEKGVNYQVLNEDESRDDSLMKNFNNFSGSL